MRKRCLPASHQNSIRVKDQVTLSELFLRFKCHYGFSVTFCNPASGKEKGNVENKLGNLRRNLFVPIPQVRDLCSWNAEMLLKCEADFDRHHYKKGETIYELFAKDRAVLAPLPVKPFRVERLMKYRTDGYGKFCTDGKHWYSTTPENAYATIIAGFGAHTLTVYSEAGDTIACHTRIYGDSRTDSCDYVTSIDMLIKKPGAWKSCELRNRLDEESRVIFDGLEAGRRSRFLGYLGLNSSVYGFEAAMSALEEAVKKGLEDEFSLQALSSRKAYDLFVDSASYGPDLTIYDFHLLSKTGGA